MNDEVPDEGDFDANRHRGEFDDITPEDFIRGMGNPPGWLPSDEINRMRREIPIPYVVVVPVRTDDTPPSDVAPALESPAAIDLRRDATQPLTAERIARALRPQLGAGVVNKW